ncbi:MAG TPA: A24 family peptidase C-terminal domain-containing protein [Methanocella sp.]|uniref:A24 family peptidase C-terminal domain-containing protein n=1 Tax=Methanocella sp. TaxID=2052833 RepID=UPI002C5E13AD|nr:A24 family peptidase C-terminal domain-containing protein [Methanocella sp.]HTY91803.1 A24 family peptidase C-terminal domain-containing protein [Methanocella sp.]
MYGWDWLNITRIVICLIILGYSCITDWRTRRAPNRLWYLLGGIGLVLGLYELYINSLELGSLDTGFLFYWGFCFIFIFIMMYLLYYLFQYFGMTGIGGADAKALMAIALMFPYYPQVNIAGVALPIAYTSRSVIFGLAVFGNALVLNLVVPVTIFIYNLATVPFGELMASPMMAFTGYKANIESLKGRHVRLMHKYTEKDGKPEIRRSFGGAEADDDTYKKLLQWKSSGLIDNKVWITPKIPFLIPITLGFIVAILWGDILTQLIVHILL